jgi:predicted nucleic acid-binding protein
VLAIDATVWVAAFDPLDKFHGRSVDFLRVVSAKGLRLCGPALAVLEVACAIARRAGDREAGKTAADRLRSYPGLGLVALDDRLLALSMTIGTERGLRGGDALYAATAEMLQIPLITWDQGLVRDSAAMTPDQWRDRHG